MYYKNSIHNLRIFRNFYWDLEELQKKKKVDLINYF